MSYQIKRSNKSVVVVERWYVNGVQKERHVMTIEPYTTPERLHALQDEFKGTKGRMPKRTYRERKDKIVRLSDEDIEKIEDSLEVTKKYQHLETAKQRHKDVTKRITETPTDTRRTAQVLAEHKKLKDTTVAEKRLKTIELAVYKKREREILER